MLLIFLINCFKIMPYIHRYIVAIILLCGDGSISLIVRMANKGRTLSKINCVRSLSCQNFWPKEFVVEGDLKEFVNSWVAINDRILVLWFIESIPPVDVVIFYFFRLCDVK